jgi:HD-GYP domain-containing protein (c-di-GMP phosphodiesterase class II)
VIGSQFGIDEGVLGTVFMTGEPVLAPCAPAAQQGPAGGASGDAPHEGVLGVCAGGGAPIRWGDDVRGALWAGTADPRREFGPGELESLSRLADLGALALEQAEMRERLENAVGSGVEALAEAIDMRDNYTWQHSKNVAELADRVADRLGLTRTARAELSFAARLHDVGKLALPDGILMKAGDLNEDEWEIMRQYPLRGAELLERVPGLGNVAQIVLCEHEHWDGSGYPKGMCGEDIPLASRVILACDAYDAMVHDRPWRSALKPWAAVRELRLGAGREYDPQVVMALIAVLRESRTSTALSALWSPRLRERV